MLWGFQALGLKYKQVLVIMLFGRYALYSNTEGLYNTAIGWETLKENTTGCYNTAIGNSALACNTACGYNNVALGNAALYNLTQQETRILL